MKLSKVFAIIFGIASLACAGASLAFMDWKESINFDEHNQYKLFAFLFIALMLVFVIIAIAKKNKLALIPLLGFVPTGIYFVKKLYENHEFNQSIIDVVSPTENTTVLTLLLFCGFIGCAIVSALKDNKYTKMYVVGYFTLLILSTIKFLPEITMNKELLPYTFLSYSMVVGYAAFLLFFFPGGEAKAQPKEEAKECDAPKAEETATTEAE